MSRPPFSRLIEGYSSERNTGAEACGAKLASQTHIQEGVANTISQCLIFNDTVQNRSRVPKCDYFGFDGTKLAVATEEFGTLNVFTITDPIFWKLMDRFRAFTKIGTL